MGGPIETFLKPVLEFINDVINRGESVLVHCLAGAHRAGTTGRSGSNIKLSLFINSSGFCCQALFV